MSRSFERLCEGGRLSFGRRFVTPVGAPKRLGRRAPMCAAPRTRARELGKVEWSADTHEATLFVGREKGKKPQNNAGRCLRFPRTFKVGEADRWFLKLRSAQIGPANVGGMRQRTRGWFQGDSEDSVAYHVIWEPSEAEPTVKDFRRNMKALAEGLAEHFCQDSVIVATEGPTTKKAYGVTWEPPKRRTKRKRK